MNCPYCKSGNATCVDSRKAKSETFRRRRYKCLDCDSRFSTYEIRAENFKKAAEEIERIRSMEQKGW